MYLLYIIIFIFISFIVFTYIFFKYIKVSKKYNLYIRTILVIGLVISFIALIQQYNQMVKKRQETITNSFIQTLQYNYIELEKLFLQYHPYSERLYQQTFLNKTIDNIKLNINSSNYSQYLFTEAHITSIMLQMLEDVYLVVSKYDNNWKLAQSREWINTWKQWFTSPIFLKNWQYLKHLYGINTINFINTFILK